MSAREWKPGDVGMVRRPGYGWKLALRTGVPGNLGWEISHPNSREWRSDSSLALRDDEIRPLVVIDPEDREQVERLGKAIYDNGFIAAGRLADALREFANPQPPKPEEPTGLGAVVEDAEGVRWVNVFERGMWQDHRDRSQWRTYEQIVAVRVLSEGVTA